VSYTYSAEVVRWVDGDTVYLRVDLGFRMTAETDFRLYGVDTPERGRPGAAEASARVRELAPIGSTVRVQTYKDPDKYGRWLAEILPPGWEADGIYAQPIGATLIAEGLAVPYFGGHKVAP
jgi:micrococcal nuclease